MSRTATAALQTPWDCKWSQFGRRARRNPDKPAEGLWVCTYGSVRRSISAEECETCPNWEFESPAECRARLQHTLALAARLHADERLQSNRADRWLERAVRGVMLALAVFFAYSGFELLTWLLAIPITIAFWCGAAAMLLFAIFGNLPASTPHKAPERILRQRSVALELLGRVKGLL